MTNEGDWRRDAAKTSKIEEAETVAWTEDSVRDVSQMQHGWGRRVRDWARLPFASWRHEWTAEDYEEVLHELATALANVNDPKKVERLLAVSARRLVEWGGVELTLGGSPRFRPEADAISVRSGDGSSWGWLEVDPSVRGKATLRRLEIAAAMASCALQRISVGRPRTEEPSVLVDETEWGAVPSGPVVHDTTFVNAIFPFALAQARRHGESLALISVAIDRLGAIRGLLGDEEADRTIEHVGRKIATMIRGSDIIARLDDHRLVVLLPRAGLDAGLVVARKLSQGIAENASLLSDVPGLTISIGVAAFPECASSLYELLDACDGALTEAQEEGRNRTSAAPRRSFERTGRAVCAVR